MTDLALRVKELPALVADHLQGDEEVDGFTAKPATALGDNYGSTMLALDIAVRKRGKGQASDKNDCRHLHVFCKMIPDNPETRVIFNVDVTFIKELEMYTLALPAMLQLQIDNGVPDEDLVSHLAPRCYGCRVSLGGSAVDSDAAILLEDMRQRGFSTGQRVAGLDFAHAKLVMEKLAVFHALPVALRRQRPQVYRDTVASACKHFFMGGEDGDAFKGDADAFVRCIQAHMRKSASASKHCDAVARICRESGLGREEKFPDVREPFASILHNDLWTNNMLFERDEGGKPTSVAFIDFQVSRINSPFKDLLFFVFSSCPADVSGEHLDELIELYVTSFRRCLEQVGVDSTPFSLSVAWEEINALARTELFHILSMLRFINADATMVRDNPETFAFMEELGGDTCTAKVEHVVLEYAKRGWL